MSIVLLFSVDFKLRYVIPGFKPFSYQQNVMPYWVGLILAPL